MDATLIPDGEIGLRSSGAGMIEAMGRGAGENVSAEPRTITGFGILFGDIKSARPLNIKGRPMLVLTVPEGQISVDREKLREIVHALSIYTLVPKSPKRAEPLNHLHRRIRRQVEELREDQAAPPAPTEVISFSNTEMACLKLPKGTLKGFKLEWNEWDTVLGAVSWAATAEETKDNAEYARLYRSLLEEDPGERAGRVSCVRCGSALTLDQAAVDPRAYRCKGCKPTN